MTTEGAHDGFVMDAGLETRHALMAWRVKRRLP
jgi:hypothetical protein